MNRFTGSFIGGVIGGFIGGTLSCVMIYFIFKNQLIKSFDIDGNGHITKLEIVKTITGIGI
jgi:hypothetical protein